MINGEGNLAAIWIAVGQDEGGQGELGGQSVNKLSGGQVGNPSPSYVTMMKGRRLATKTLSSGILWNTASFSTIRRKLARVHKSLISDTS